MQKCFIPLFWWKTLEWLLCSSVQGTHLSILKLKIRVMIIDFKFNLSRIYTRRFCWPTQISKQHPSKNQAKIWKQFTDFSKAEKSLHWGEILVKLAWRISKIGRQSLTCVNLALAIASALKTRLYNRNNLPGLFRLYFFAKSPMFLSVDLYLLSITFFHY